MITLNASGGSVTFTFSGNSTYLNDGVITCPVNSLALIIDESDMATFRKAASNDIFVSANIAEFGMTKAELESWYKANMVGSTGGGGGVTSGEVQTMIDESISGKADSSDVYTTGQTSGATEIANALNAKLDTTAYTPTDLSEYWTSAQTQSAITQATSGKADTSYVDQSVSGKADTDSLSAYTINEGIASSSQTYVVEVTYSTPVNVYTLDKSYEGIFFNLERNYAQRYLIGYDENDTEIGRFYINAQEGYDPIITVDTTGFTDVAIYKTILSSSAATVAIEGNEISAIKKLNFYEQYWATDTATTVYFYNNGYNVTDAFKYDLKKLEGGNSISIEKTASAYIISASLPLSAGTGQYSIIEGYRTQASGYCSHAEGDETTAGGTCSHAEGSLTYAIGQDSHAEGYRTTASGQSSHTEGRDTIANNDFEHASGLYNISSSGSSSFGDSGNTLFSVGNGNYGGPRHNTFEIRQNGDIYIADTNSTGEFYEKSMIKLQDQLGGGVDSGTVQTMIDESISGKADSSAVTEEISAAVSGKQDTLIAGRGISITTGETADTVSFNLPISAGTGENSIIEGYQTSATSIYSHAEGYITIASGSYSHAEGYNTIASNSSSHVEGGNNTASGAYSHAEGQYTTASGRTSHAEGEYSKANGRNSHAEGDNTIANNQSEHASGYWNISNTGESTSAQTLFSVGNGAWDDTLQETVRHNAFEIRKNGDIYITKDGSDVKLQDQLGGGVDSGTVQTMIDESISGKADSSAVTEEISAAVSGKQDTLIAGRGISITTGETADTVSFNLPISAGTGENSIIEGYQTSATSIYSHAEGYITIASGSYSHAEGYNTIASNSSSHVEGGNNTASGAYSHAEGQYTTASGRTSHAEGEYSKANGRNSHAEGDNTIANNQSEHASGYWNISNTGESTSAQTLFSVGNGAWDDTLQETVRHNAFEIRKNGDIYITKDGSDVKLQDQLGGGGSSYSAGTGIDITNDVISVTGMVATSSITTAVTSGSTDVLTSGGAYEQFGGLKIVKLTESEYAALVTKDPNVLYVVIPDPSNP